MIRDIVYLVIWTAITGSGVQVFYGHFTTPRTACVIARHRSHARILRIINTPNIRIDEVECKQKPRPPIEFEIVPKKAEGRR